MSIESIHTEDRIFYPSKQSSKNSRVKDLAQYQQLCESYKSDYEGTWGKLANDLLIWDEPFTKNFLIWYNHLPKY